MFHNLPQIPSEVNEKELNDLDKLSLDDSIKERHKRSFQSEPKNIYDIKS